MIGVAWLGHSTVVLELGGIVLLTDPILRDRVVHLIRPGIDQADRATTPDVVLISHGHRDHFDRPSLELIHREARVVVPRGLGKSVSKLGFPYVEEVQAGDHVDIGVRIDVTHAQHAGHAVGYVAGDVYFAGDTDLFPEMASIRSRVALLPVGGWGPRLPPGHLNPARAAQALALLLPEVAIPIHWGGFRPFYKRTAYGAEAGAEFAELASSAAPSVEVRVLHPGETFVLS